MSEGAGREDKVEVKGKDKKNHKKHLCDFRW